MKKAQEMQILAAWNTCLQMIVSPLRVVKQEFHETDLSPWSARQWKRRCLISLASLSLAYFTNVLNNSWKPHTSANDGLKSVLFYFWHGRSLEERNYYKRLAEEVKRNGTGYWLAINVMIVRGNFSSTIECFQWKISRGFKSKQNMNW